MGPVGLSATGHRGPAHLVIVGGGPAGFGVVRALARHGHDWAGSGVVLVDEDPARHLGVGVLGGYHTTSDTAGQVFLETAGVDRDLAGAVAGSPLGALYERFATRAAVPLSAAADLLRVGAAPFLAAGPGTGPQLVGGEVTAITPGPPHRVCVANGTGRHVLEAEHVVVAAGGVPWVPGLLRAAGGGRLLHSDSVLRRDGAYAACLAALPARPKVVVVGGSHSAFAAARTLLAEPVGAGWPEGTVRLVHRRPVRVTYPDAARARQAGARFTDADICQKTGLVHRFAGLRTDSAALYERIVRGTERRIETTVAVAPPAVLSECRDADLVVAATGYTSRAAGLLPSLHPAGGDPDVRPRLPVNQDAQLLDARGLPRPGLFALGLGSGAVPDRVRHGGEASYTGEVDGVWYYQHAIGPRIAAHLARPAP